MNSTFLQEARVMLVELLAAEKENTRVWLRAEMDGLVDPMLDSIFNRLQTKLTKGLERTQSGGAGNGELMNPTENELPDVNLCQSYPVNTQPSTLNPQSNHQPPSIDYEPENDPKILAEVKREIEEERQMQLNMHNNQIDNRQLELQVNGEQSIDGLERTQSGAGDCAQVGNHDGQLCPPPNQLHQSSFVIGQPSTSSHLIPPHQNVHYSYQQPNDSPIHSNDNSNQQSESNSLVQLTIPPNAQVNSAQVYHDELCNESSGQVQHSSSLPATIVNEQFNQNLNIEDDDEGVCECDECVNGIEIDEEVDDDDDDSDSDSVQWIEDEQEDKESSRPVKRPRMELTQPNNATTQPEVASQSPQQATSEAQPNQVTNQFITVHLQCPLSECPDTFTEDQLNQHMFDVHLIGPSRCLVKDCGLFFDNSYLLRDHIKQSHQSTTQFHCNKCPKHFAKYQQLYKHNYEYHQHGHFQCSFSACTFTGEFRMKMYDHYRQRHKREFVCSQTACNYRTHIEAKLKTHERAHLGIKPFRCKWANCHYSSSHKHNCLSHIRTRHLARLESPNQAVALLANPKDYLEVASELL